MLKFAQSVASAASLAAAVTVLAFAPLAAAQTVYKVGSTPTGVPFTFLDVKSNTIQGAMVDLITAIGEDAGFKVDVQPTPFSALIGYRFYRWIISLKNSLHNYPMVNSVWFYWQGHW